MQKENLLILFSLILTSCLYVQEVSAMDKVIDAEEKDLSVANTKPIEVELPKAEDSSDTSTLVTAPLEISGFVDTVSALYSGNHQLIALGDLELDIEFAFGEHYATSAALVWNDDGAEVGVAVLDYHVFNEQTPARGRIFSEPGFHLQVGRFDIPFGVDYEYFAAPDRPTITPPLSTIMVQNQGFNGDGMRLYGAWRLFHYAFFTTNSLYKEGGYSWGGHLGFFPGQDPYRLHQRDASKTFCLGLSYLNDMKVSGTTRELLVGTNIGLSIGLLEILGEIIWHNSEQDRKISEAPFTLKGKKEWSYYLLAKIDLSLWTSLPLYSVVRIETWRPLYRLEIVENEMGTVDLVNVKTVNRVVIALDWQVNDYMQIKLEYFDHLKPKRELLGISKRQLSGQLVASF